MATKVLDCGCADNPNGLHMKTCPVWVNVGPDLRNRNYVRRDTYGTDDERFPAHPEPTCTYNITCQDTPDPGSIDGLCTYHRADAERYDDGEEWPR